LDIKKIKGLKYPDEYFIKFFYTKKLHQRDKLSILELGCSNGNNLMLASSYNHHVIGVDLDEKLIGNAIENYQISKFTSEYNFYHMNMMQFCQLNRDVNSEVLLLANSVYYISKSHFVELLRNIKNNCLIQKNSLIFLRFRNLNDHRKGCGKNVDEDSLILNTYDENGLLCQFYDNETMLNILSEELNLRDFETMDINYDIIQNNKKFRCCDTVIWGQIN